METVVIKKFKRQCADHAKDPSYFPYYETIYEYNEAREAVQEVDDCCRRFVSYTDNYVGGQSLGLNVFSSHETLEDARKSSIIQLFPYGTDFSKILFQIREID